MPQKLHVGEAAYVVSSEHFFCDEDVCKKGDLGVCGEYRRMYLLWKINVCMYDLCTLVHVVPIYYYVHLSTTLLFNSAGSILAGGAAFQVKVKNENARVSRL